MKILPKNKRSFLYTFVRKEGKYMTYTKEDKLRIVKLYLEGVQVCPEDLSPSQKNNLKKKIKRWVATYKNFGEEGLEPRTRRFTAEQKLEAIERVLKGESRYQVSYSLGITKETLRDWISKYMKYGRDGIKDPNEAVYFKSNNDDKTGLSNLLEENARLKTKINELEIEVEYLKKLNALIQK